MSALRSISLRHALAIAGLTGVVLVVTAGFVAAQVGDPRLIHVCVKKSGEMKFVDPSTECRRGYEPTSWPGVAMGPIEVLRKTSPMSSENKTLQLDCPADKIAIGGGARIIGELVNTALIANGPEGPIARPNSWMAVAQEMGTGNPQPWALRVDVTCASMLPK